MGSRLTIDLHYIAYRVIFKPETSLEIIDAG